MPYRIHPLVTNEFYHIFNRGIDKRPTFTDAYECHRAMQILDYYRHVSPPLKLSRFLKLSLLERDDIMRSLVKYSQKLVSIISFCLMPNHFHFLLRQNIDNGISKFIGLFENSFTRYFNTRHERVGPLFLDQFKSVRMETDEQLMHVSRYIHLNPYTSYVVKDVDSLIKYPYSSLPEYIGLNSGPSDAKVILSFFKNKEQYKQFVIDQKDYQRTLDKIKHLTFEE